MKLMVLPIVVETGRSLGFEGSESARVLGLVLLVSTLLYVVPRTAVLGAILIHNEAFNHATELIDSRDFFRDAHRRIFDKMVALSERNDAIDPITLKDELPRPDELDEVGGPPPIASLPGGGPRAPWGFVPIAAAIGARRVLSSSFPVDDQATALLMKRFYLSYTGPASPSPERALREAQRFVRTYRDAAGRQPFRHTGRNSR